jgi:hypothetical protein
LTAKRRSRLRELVGDVAPDELERLARADELLRTAATVLDPDHTLVRGTHELKLTLAELTAVSKALRAARTLGPPPPEDRLLDDAIAIVDLALKTH